MPVLQQLRKVFPQILTYCPDEPKLHVWKPGYAKSAETQPLGRVQYGPELSSHQFYLRFDRIGEEQRCPCLAVGIAVRK